MQDFIIQPTDAQTFGDALIEHGDMDGDVPSEEQRARHCRAAART